jgi:nitrite reductase/ring-hydroxylating ferredoxin subunit
MPGRSEKSVQTRASGPPRVPHIGTYRRELPVAIERLYENAIDWEHLPYVHRSTFSSVECIAAGTWGFRARVAQRFREDRRPFVIELKLDRDCRRWITTTLEGPGSGSEVWTHAFSTGPRRTDIVVDFFVPGAASERIPILRDFYQKLYSRLYDEDVSMMSLRQQRLDEIRSGRADETESSILLGRFTDLDGQLPVLFSFRGRAYQLIEDGGELLAFASICPHMLGPLDRGDIRNGVVECPWHGYRFDVRSGACVSGSRCALAPAPKIRISAGGDVIAEVVDRQD